jgi:transcriptional regulator with XRE-family HTH domain
MLAMLVVTRVQVEHAPSVRNEELRVFLRSRRKRITPREVGLPQQIGRRLPGLRREDVAELAGMSVGWYARLELGQLDGIAPQTLAAVARALKLDHHETTYLFALTRTPMPPSDDDDHTEVAKNFRILVEGFTAGTAMIISARCDVLVSNAIAQDVGFSSVRKGLERNFAWQIFTNPLFRERVVEWDEMARATAGYLRESYAHHVDDPAFDELIDALRSESEAFASYWDERVVSPPGALSMMRLRVDDGGVVEVARTTTALIDAPGQYLTFLVPLDANDLPRLRHFARGRLPDVPVGA